jgi:hypothetical protein
MAKPINKTAILRGKEARIFHSLKNLPSHLFAKEGYLFFLWQRGISGKGKQKKRADGVWAMTMKLTVSPATQPISRILKGAFV